MDTVKIIRRADGRVEVPGADGAGHPSRALTEALGTPWQDWMGVHGCGGACATEAWEQDESDALADVRSGKRVPAKPHWEF